MGSVSLGRSPSCRFLIGRVRDRERSFTCCDSCTVVSIIDIIIIKISIMVLLVIIVVVVIIISAFYSLHTYNITATNST